MKSDRRLIYASAFLRALATGMIGVLIGIYLAETGFNPKEIGIVVASGLIGAAFSAIIVTFKGDYIGRARSLVIIALFSFIGGIGVAFGSEMYVIAIAAFLGMLNGMGRDRGASLIIDQSILAVTAGNEERTSVFAWYNVLQDIGHALGGLAAAAPYLIRQVWDIEGAASLRFAVIFYACLLFITTFLYAGLSSQTEKSRGERVKLSPESKKILWKIASLFGLDSLAGGFLTSALLAFFFYKRFGVSEGVVGLLFFGARIANAVSHLGAAWLAKRIGLVNTMVFTHIPSSILLMTVPFAPNFPVAAALFLLREGLVEMDVPTRQSYVMAVMKAEERTFASGVTHLVRLGAWAAAPAFAGSLMQDFSMSVPLFIGGGMKIAYDISLYFAFRHLKPPEESN